MIFKLAIHDPYFYASSGFIDWHHAARRHLPAIYQRFAEWDESDQSSQLMCRQEHASRFDKEHEDFSYHGRGRAGATVWIVKRSSTSGAVTGICLGHAAIGRPLMSDYCYYLDGLLIDTSAKIIAVLCWKFCRNFLWNVALTHYHEDHAGNAAYLHQSFFMARVGWRQDLPPCSRKGIACVPMSISCGATFESMQAQEMGAQLKTVRYCFDVIEVRPQRRSHRSA